MAVAEHFIRDHPELKPFVLSDVHLIGKKIGSGAYGQVEEVVVPVGAAAKTIYAFLGEAKAATEFTRECKLMSNLRHPNIVQFLGVTFFPGSRLPALVMERLLTNLHDLLAPEPPHSSDAVPHFSTALKCSVLHNVACGLAYLHERSPPVIHRDLSARNVLLNSEMVAKIADLGVARVVPPGSTMTKGPGALVYMPPEAFAEKSKYDSSIDVFSLGVTTIFTIGEVFPCNPLESTYFDEKSGMLLGRTELQRRSKYLRYVNEQLRACGQLRGDHPLIRLIQQCLHNLPAKRPSIREVLRLLEEAGASVRDEDSERNKRELVRALQTQPRNQNLEHVLTAMVTENARKEKELAGALQQLRLNAEMTTAREASRREQQQIQEMRQRETELVQAKEREIAMLQPLTRPKVLGPGLTSATVNNETSILVEFPQVNVTAQLQPVLNASSNRMSPKSSLLVTPSRYEVLYTPVSRGQHELHVQVNDREINGSPFTVTVYPDPLQLGRPVRTITGLNRPRGIAFNNHKHMIVTEWGINKVSIFDINGQKIQSLGSYGNGPDQMIYPKNIVTDSVDNLYVSSDHKLQKFSSSGVLVRCIGSKQGVGTQKGEFNFPRGITLYNEQAYVCDSKNDRIQVFDLDLNFVRSIDTRHSVDTAYDIKFDAAGNMYIADSGYKRVVVMDCSGRFVRTFGEGKLIGPSGLHIADKYVYVCDPRFHCIVVYETTGQFVTSFGKLGRNDGEFDGPRCIISCSDGFLYVCDFNNNRVQIF